MYSTFIKVAAILGALAVVLGAFGAHALKQKLSDATLNIFETAVRYHFYHVLALLMIGILHRDFSNKWMIWAGWSMIIGIILFSGSLYVLTYVKASEKTAFNWIGAITPFGGLAFIAGWFFIFLSVLRSVKI
jgi:uncharacterized membrane protein YgdD (TMEM256/DUF423 family)